MGLLGVVPGGRPRCTCGAEPGPGMARIADALTTKHLRPALQEAGADPDAYVLHVDTTPVLHSILCPVSAAQAANAMTNPAGDVFYPDSPADAAWFAEQHGAQPNDAEAFAGFFDAYTDDNTPTTGPPADYHFPPGCGCHYREDADWGEVRTPPPGGCRVHTPWAFTPAAGSP